MIEAADSSIIVGSETWLTSSIYSSEIFSREVLRKGRPDGYGGVLLALKKDLIFDQLDISSETESVYAKLSFDRNKILIVGAVYRPHSSDSDYLLQMCSDIKEITNQHKGA